jgi:hypothetical protein
VEADRHVEYHVVRLHLLDNRKHDTRKPSPDLNYSSGSMPTTSKGKVRPWMKLEQLQASPARVCTKTAAVIATKSSRDFAMFPLHILSCFAAGLALPTGMHTNHSQDPATPSHDVYSPSVVMSRFGRSLVDMSLERCSATTTLRQRTAPKLPRYDASAVCAHLRIETH